MNARRYPGLGVLKTLRQPRFLLEFILKCKTKNTLYAPLLLHYHIKRVDFEKKRNMSGCRAIGEVGAVFGAEILGILGSHKKEFY